MQGFIADFPRFNPVTFLVFVIRMSIVVIWTFTKNLMAHTVKKLYSKLSGSNIRIWIDSTKFIEDWEWKIKVLGSSFQPLIDHL